MAVQWRAEWYLSLVPLWYLLGAASKTTVLFWRHRVQGLPVQCMLGRPEGWFSDIEAQAGVCAVHSCCISLLVLANVVQVEQARMSVVQQNICCAYFAGFECC